MSLLQKFFIFSLISSSGLPIVVLNNGESLSCGHSLTQAYKISSYFLKHHVKAQKYQKVAYRHQFNLFDLRSETALNKDGGVEALGHIKDQQVGAIIQRPLATHVSLSINFGSHSQREFRKRKHKSRLQILPPWLWGYLKSTKVHISVPKYSIIHLWVCWVDHLADISVVEA